LKRALATNDGFSKDAQSTVTAQKKKSLYSQRFTPTYHYRPYQEPELFLVPAFHNFTCSTDYACICQECVGCFTIFRNEIETETLWAGRNKDERNMRPCESFEAWREKDKLSEPGCSYSSSRNPLVHGCRGVEIYSIIKPMIV